MPSPVPNPSREIEKLWTRTWDMAASWRAEDWPKLSSTFMIGRPGAAAGSDARKEHRKMSTREITSTEAPSPKISRRRLVVLGTTGVAGAAIARIATADAAPTARTQLGGIHID